MEAVRIKMVLFLFASSGSRDVFEIGGMWGCKRFSKRKVFYVCYVVRLIQ